MTGSACHHPSEDRLIDLATHLADAREREDALEIVRMCPECEAHFKEVCRRLETVRLGPRPRIEDGRISLVGRPARAIHGPSRTMVAMALGAAAAVTLAVLLLWGPGGRSPSDGLDYWLPTDSERMLFRSGSPPGTAHAKFSEAIEAYTRHDTRRVVDLLAHEPMDEIAERPMKLLLASALVWEGRNAEAKRRVEELQVERIPVPYRDRARWVLLTALERSGDREEARKILEELAAGSGPFSEQARRRLTADAQQPRPPEAP